MGMIKFIFAGVMIFALACLGWYFIMAGYVVFGSVILLLDFILSFGVVWDLTDRTDNRGDLR